MKTELIITKKVKTMSRFSETFDVPNLCKEILERIKIPAESGKLYQVECTGISKPTGFNIEFEFRTDDNRYMMMKFNLESNFDKCMDFISSLGYDYQNVENVKGNRYEVFYQDNWNMFIIKKLH